MLRLRANQLGAASPPAGVKELFIEELAEVHGGSVGDPLEKVRDMLLTTYACCEEGIQSCC